jgi:hypothetical protein
MALTIPQPQEDRPEDGALVADRRLYLDAGQTMVLEEGDSGAAFLLAASGNLIPAADCARLRLELVEGQIIQRPPRDLEADAPAVEE